MNNRIWLPVLMTVGGLAAVAWAVLRVQLPPADFTFANGPEAKTLDPHNVTGHPEHRILASVFEGLTHWEPKTLVPVPGAAESWDLSEDKRVYTFHLRQDARWSNGEPVTAHDFVYSYRRFLDPLSAAEYAYQAWYIKNAKRYSVGAAGIGPGDLVEVELNEQPLGALPYARGEVLYGKLVRIRGEGNNRIFVVDVGGQERQFRIGEFTPDVADSVGPCKQVLLDFREVGVRAIDDYTLEQRLENPTPFWLGLTVYHAALPVNKTNVETYGKQLWANPDKLVSNGPYRIAFRRIRDRVRLVKNEHYWNADNVRLNVIDALSIESKVTMFNLYETGMVDWSTETPTIVVQELLQPGHERPDFQPKPYLCTYYYLLNTKRKPLDDVRVRRALALALDREEITRTAVAGGEVPALTLVPPGMPNYKGPTPPQESVAEAQRLLAEAGYPNGRGFPKLEILYNKSEAHETIAQLARKQWERNLGITASTRNEEWGSSQNSIRQFQYTVARRSWVGDYPDPNTYLDMMVTGGENNNTGWSHPQYDRLIAAAAEELDENKRMQIFVQAERILIEQMPIIPIYYYVDDNLVKPYVRGFYRNLLDTHDLHLLWIDHDLVGPNEFMSE